MDLFQSVFPLENRYLGIPNLKIFAPAARFSLAVAPKTATNKRAQGEGRYSERLAAGAIFFKTDLVKTIFQREIQDSWPAAGAFFSKPTLQNDFTKGILRNLARRRRKKIEIRGYSRVEIH